jgi:hypothetical protein
MALYGEIKFKFNEDGSVSLNASHCTADGGAAEIEKELRAFAAGLGAEWKQEKHLLLGGAGHHHSHANDHHQHN